ncbi:hypothetical protein C5167_036923 [Papaver somniferum]|uniref:Uncharacterized protein n=1 Tax=Papaver somniferum TaxID=3469 RepID=A0A4Y7I8K9_PAPSO|nr:hypothetical protein C5167_036923 [Papaver somniferum]
MASGQPIRHTKERNKRPVRFLSPKWQKSRATKTLVVTQSKLSLLKTLGKVFFLAQRKNWRKKEETLLVNYIVTGSNGTDHNIDIPSKGGVFDDDEIYNFYKEYAKN